MIAALCELAYITLQSLANAELLKKTRPLTRERLATLSGMGRDA